MKPKSKGARRPDTRYQGKGRDEYGAKVKHQLRRSQKKGRGR